jgi:hypothetical protein
VAFVRLAALLAAVVAGIAVAVWQTSVAMEAIFVFRNNEPATSWLAVGLGPLLTLLGCILALFHRLAGSITVIAGGLLSAIAFLIGERGVTEYLPAYLLKFTVPILIVGAVLFLLSRWRTLKGPGHAT